jgi:simple sugar transport system ATP-binding protein
MVFQHFSLFDSLTVLENIALGMSVDVTDQLRDRISDVSSRYGLPLDPLRSVYTLSVGERQRIEIVRCLLQEPRLLIMDEPTSVLTPAEVSELFATLERLAAEGMAILYISHKLEEIRQLCHQATILRGGRKVAEADPAVESARSLASLMMGSEMPVSNSRQVSRSGNVLLRVDSLSHAAADSNGISLHELLITLFLFITAPVSAHMLAKAALQQKLRISEQTRGKPWDQ